MEEYEIIRDLYKFKMKIKESNANSIDFETSDFYCYIKKSEIFSKIYDKNIQAYNSLRNDNEYQEVVINFFRHIKQIYKKQGIEIYTYEYFMPLPIPIIDNLKNTRKHLTLLYLNKVDKLINELHPQQQDYIKNSSDMSLLERNLLIYSYYPNYPNSLLKDMFEITRRARNTYSFYFFDIEKNKQQKINLYEQVKIACLNMIDEFIVKTKKKDTNNDKNINLNTNDKQIELYLLTLTDKENQVLKELLSHPSWSNPKIGNIKSLSITPETVKTHIENICKKFTLEKQNKTILKEFIENNKQIIANHLNKND